MGLVLHALFSPEPSSWPATGGEVRPSLAEGGVVLKGSTQSVTCGNLAGNDLETQNPELNIAVPPQIFPTSSRQPAILGKPTIVRPGHLPF